MQQDLLASFLPTGRNLFHDLECQYFWFLRLAPFSKKCSEQKAEQNFLGDFALQPCSGGTRGHCFGHLCALATALWGSCGAGLGALVLSGGQQ